MSITLDTRPTKWARTCLEDGGSFDYCSALTMGEFVVRGWGIDANDYNALLSINLQADPRGSIASIDSFPNGRLYSPEGNAGSVLSRNIAQDVPAFGPNGTPIYKYTPLLETGDGHDIIGLWTVEINGIEVTLKNGDSCQINFHQTFDGGKVALAYEMSTTRQSNFSVIQTGSRGHIDWGDGTNLEYFDATGGSKTTSHTYASAGTHNVKVYCNDSLVTAVDLNSQQLTGTTDISKLDKITSLNLSSNANMSTLVPSASHDATMTLFNLLGNGISGALDLSSYDLTGTVSFRDAVNLTNVSFGTSTGTLTFLSFQGCTSLSGTLDLTGLDITGTFGCASATMSEVIFGTAATAVLTVFTMGSTTNVTSVDTSNLDIIGTVGMADSALTSWTLGANSGNILELDMNGGVWGYVDLTAQTFSSAVDIFLQDNAMTATEVNHYLVDLDATLPGTGTGNINIGGTNAAPDGSSGGYDGLTAKANLISAGYTLTTS